jgi:DNA-binding SARP family transcriptional activator/tetratricopeptide (TPR) repeat protein
VRYRILGRLQVVVPNDVAYLAAPRQQIVLAILLLEANHVVPVNRLVDAVWDEDPPLTARSQIQICVSALRRTLADAGFGKVIVTLPPGYMLRVDDGDLDLQVFEKLVTDGRLAASQERIVEAGELYGRALALWTGAPMAGVPSPLVQSAALNLRERHLALLEDSIEMQLKLGCHHEVIGELMDLTAHHPNRERLRAQLMMALYRDGRQAEALDAYRSVRQTLVAELGLEPGRELQRLERAILEGNSALAAPAPMSPAPMPAPNDTGETLPLPRLLPADIAEFTGRGPLLRQIRRALTADAPSRSGVIVSVVGMGGSGKTTIAVHVAHSLADAYPDGQLYVALRDGDGQLVPPGRVLERFLRVLGVSGDSMPDGIEERAEMYRDRVAGRHMLIVLDDAADEDQVMPLLPGGEHVAVLITSRPRLTGLPGARWFEVGVLRDDEAVELLAQVAGAERVAAEPSAVGQLIDACGGLPLALRIAAARIASRPHWTIARFATRLSNEHRRLDELAHGGVGIRTSIAVAYKALSKEGQRLFRRLGILAAPDFAAWVSGPLLNRHEEQAEDLLESLVDVRLLGVLAVEKGVVRYRLHDLIKAYARERLVIEEPVHEQQETLRRVISAWLYLVREAHRREYGGDYTILHGSAELWPLSEHVVASLLDDPLDWYETERLALVAAVRQAASSGLAELCWDLAISTVSLLETRSYLNDWRETHQIALDSVRQAGNRRGEAAMLYSMGALSLVERRFEEAAKQLHQALNLFTELGDVHGQGLSQRNLAYLDREQGDFDSSLHRYTAAIAALRQAGDSMGEAQAMGNMAQISIERGAESEAESLLKSALGIARAVGAQRVEAQILHRLGELFVRLGQLSAGRSAFESVLVLVRATDDHVGEAYALHGLGTIHIRLARYAEAERTLADAHRMAARTGHRLLTAQVTLALGELRLADGQTAEAVDCIRESRIRFEQLGATPWTERADQLLADAEGRPSRAGRRAGGPNPNARKISVVAGHDDLPPGSVGQT